MLAVPQYGCASPADLAPLTTLHPRFTKAGFRTSLSAFLGNADKRIEASAFVSVF